MTAKIRVNTILVMFCLSLWSWGGHAMKISKFTKTCTKFSGLLLRKNRHGNENWPYKWHKSPKASFCLLNPIFSRTMLTGPNYDNNIYEHAAIKPAIETMLKWVKAKKKLQENPQIEDLEKILIELQNEFFKKAIEHGSEDYLVTVIIELKNYFRDGEKKGKTAQVLHDEIVEGYALLIELTNSCNEKVRTAVFNVVRQNQAVIDQYGYSFLEIEEACANIIRVIEDNKLVSSEPK